jgi:7,8-dihydropterin-6-yl-methyl-4-(beta-D-ribofuranosyl)aminobenzene 5'-phosphate synthase
MKKTDSIRITILIDNQAGTGLVAEHGFSLWIEAGDRHVLFDTGQGPAFLHNVQRLDIPLEKTDVLVLSHGHYDHTGGMDAVLRNAPKMRIILHPNAVVPRYRIFSDGQAKSIGMPSSAATVLNRLPDNKIQWSMRTSCFAPFFRVTGPIPRETLFEQGENDLSLDQSGDTPDLIEDDQALLIETASGLIVCAGCAHSGLINTLNYARALSGISRIRAVIGGFHLLNADDQRIQSTLAELKTLAPEFLVPCHCTGERPMQALQAAFGNRVQLGRSGAIFEF